MCTWHQPIRIPNKSRRFTETISQTFVCKAQRSLQSFHRMQLDTVPLSWIDCYHAWSGRHMYTRPYVAHFSVWPKSNLNSLRMGADTFFHWHFPRNHLSDFHECCGNDCVIGVIGSHLNHPPSQSCLFTIKLKTDILGSPTCFFAQALKHLSMSAASGGLHNPH